MIDYKFNFTIEMFRREINRRFISRLNNEIKIFDFYLIVSINHM